MLHLRNDKYCSEVQFAGLCYRLGIGGKHFQIVYMRGRLYIEGNVVDIRLVKYRFTIQSKAFVEDVNRPI